MTDQSTRDVDALLGEERAGDLAHRAQLVAKLSAMLEAGHAPATSDVALLAAYLDHGLTQEERLSLYGQLASSADGRADLGAAIELIEAIRDSQVRPSAAVMSRAREIAMEQSKREPRRSIWGVLWAPRVRFGFGAAVAALAALVIWAPQMGMMNRGAVSPTSTSRAWGAVAVSGAGNTFGIAQGAPTREEAMAKAALDCKGRHGENCAVVASGQGQCFAIASDEVGPPVAKAADIIGEAQRRALATCQEGLKSGSSCTLTSTFCSEK